MGFNATAAPLRRGELAKRIGCNIETIRYYEKAGLLQPPVRSDGGHRLYYEQDQARLHFIVRSRELGFSIEELRSLLSLVDSGSYSCGEVLALAEQHLRTVQTKIDDLLKLQRTLKSIAARCEGGDAPRCPIIEALWQ